MCEVALRGQACVEANWQGRPTNVICETTTHHAEIKLFNDKVRRKTHNLCNETYCHNLLGKCFKFVVDYHALVHVVNQPLHAGCIVGWTMLLMEFDFGFVYNARKSHLILDRLCNDP